MAAHFRPFCAPDAGWQLLGRLQTGSFGRAATIADIDLPKCTRGLDLVRNAADSGAEYAYFVPQRGQALRHYPTNSPRRVDAFMRMF
jgi:hypothetical protein